MLNWIIGIMLGLILFWSLEAWLNVTGLTAALIGIGCGAAAIWLVDEIDNERKGRDA
jgi:uncharacterized membrane protein YadS